MPASIHRGSSCSDAWIKWFTYSEEFWSKRSQKQLKKYRAFFLWKRILRQISLLPPALRLRSVIRQLQKNGFWDCSRYDSLVLSTVSGTVATMLFLSGREVSNSMHNGIMASVCNFGLFRFRSLHAYFLVLAVNPIPTRLFLCSKNQGGGGTILAPPAPSKNPVTLLRIHSSKVFLKLVQKWISWHHFGFHGNRG